MLNSSHDLTEPDDLMGAIMAIEGIRDAAVLLNGPTGCRSLYAPLSDSRFPRSDHLDWTVYDEEFYFGRPRVPSTYLDETDYVFGSAAKLKRLLAAITAKDYALIAVINSPAAALIGDDLERLLREANSPVPAIAIETPGFSRSIAQGFQNTLRAALRQLAPPEMQPIPKQINLLGISIYHKYWEGNVATLRQLLQPAGITVGTVLSADCSVADIRQMRQAECNVVIHEEYADQLTPWLASEYGMKTLLPQEGAPIGFDATETWIREVCQTLKVDPTPSLKLILDAKRRAFLPLNRFNRETGLPKGATFAIRAEASLAYPLLKWLYSYLGMVPVAIQVTETSNRLARACQDYLNSIDRLEAWNADLKAQAPDIIFSNGATLSRLIGEGLSVSGVELSLPSTDHIDIIPKALLGTRGTLFILEHILNNLHHYYL